ncbi:carbohydrate esterase family 4 protein [Mycena leptocephala]|nr:carbohydrate esterase family 4 protein [Mycena leptocephala]
MRSATLLAAAALMLGARADQTEADAAVSLDPTTECAPYSFAPIQAALSSFPPPGQIVSGILSGDTAGQTKFASMQAGIPNIQPKGIGGVLNPNISYSPTDPDCWWTFGQCTTPKTPGVKADIASVPEPRTLGYGFDDGPNCSHNAFYDYLAEKQQKATMFYIGTNVMYQPLQAQRAAVDGHEICVHSWSHRAMTAFTNEQAFGELWYTMQLIKLVTGVTPTCWRPPQGDVDDRIRYIAQQLGLDNVLWKFDAFDWKVASGQATPAEVQANYDSLIADVGKGTFDTIGAILLTHELNNYTMQTALDNYPKLAEAFDHIVPVGVCMNKTQPYVENTVTFPSFAAYVANRSTSGSSSGGSSGGSSDNSSTGSGGIVTGASAGVSLRLSCTGLLALALGLLSAVLML